MWKYVYNRILCSHKKEILPCTKAWMDPEGTVPSEVKSDGKRQISNDLMCIWDMEKQNKNQTHRYKQTVGCQRDGMGY